MEEEKGEGWRQESKPAETKVICVALDHYDTDVEQQRKEVEMESGFMCALVCRGFKANLLFVSSDRSSYSDSVLLLVWQLFHILSISANIFSFSF